MSYTEVNLMTPINEIDKAANQDEADHFDGAYPRIAKAVLLELSKGTSADEVIRMVSERTNLTTAAYQWFISYMKVSLHPDK